MARLYLDEDVHQGLAAKLRERGHNVQTSNEAGNSNKRFPDDKQLAYAADHDRIILTNNRRDFDKEHRASPGHKGIIGGYHDKDLDRFANYVDAIVRNNNLENVNIRANVNEFIAENKAGERNTYTYDQPRIQFSHSRPSQAQGHDQAHQPKSPLDTVLTAIRPPASPGAAPWEPDASSIADRLRALEQRGATAKADTAEPAQQPANPASPRKPAPGSSPSP